MQSRRESFEPGKPASGIPELFLSAENRAQTGGIDVSKASLGN